MTGPRTRRSAPVVPQATTAGKSWDRRRCHARPNSRLAFNRTHKADYRDQDHLWSGRFKYISGCPHRPRGAALRVESNAEGLAELAAFCGDHQVELVVMEATGGYERLAFTLLWEAGVACAIVNPRQVRRFAEAMGFLEKTDAIDAGVIAWYGEAKRVAPCAPEQLRAASPIPKRAGSSPRVRGTAGFEVDETPVHRFIPRACGEQEPNPALEVPCGRFIPARAGNRRAIAAAASGDSVHPPRVRGTDGSDFAHSSVLRFIPARAGNSRHRLTVYGSPAVHPRACGEQSVVLVGTHAEAGSSPRVRGTVSPIIERVYQRRFIPARAGNRRMLMMVIRLIIGSSPARAGEQSSPPDRIGFVSGSSPRVRGTVARLHAHNE